MPIDALKNQIDRFLENSTPEVMAIKGDWGVGKTFSWNKFLKDAAEGGNVSLEKYSYVSLFGINSLEAFKFSIFENVVDRDFIGTEASIDSFKKNTSSLLKSLGKKSVRYFRDSSLLDGFNPAIESLSFLSLNKSIICIDDLERKGSELNLRDILGLISLLKEQKKCKIVILLNEGEEGLEDYKKYKEKVVDIEITFAPTPEECSSIAFDYSKKGLVELGTQTQKLGIKNIRILKKIERLVELTEPLAADLEPETKNQIIHSLTLYAWCYNCSEGDSSIPSLDYVTNLGYCFSGIGEDKEIDEQEKQWKSKLHDYGYSSTDELDLILAAIVKTGYVADKDFNQAATVINEQILANKSEKSFHNAWKIYHESFDNNQEDVVNTLYESFKLNTQNISLTNLNGTVMLFRELGRNELASEIIDHYIEERKANTELFNLKDSDFFGDVKDDEIAEKFEKIYVDSVTTENISEVLARISSQNGWNQSDEIILATASEDEYYTLFKSEKSENLAAYVNACLQFGRYSNASDRQNKITERATEALLRIAQESEINRRRVRKFGIELPAQT